MTKQHSQQEGAAVNIDTMPLEELRKRVARATELLDEVEQLLPGMTSMPEPDRRHSNGRLRDGEPAALGRVLDVAARWPRYFTVLADLDEGHDPEQFETAVLRERLERRNLLSDLGGRIEPLARKIDDSVLQLGEMTRPVILAAYQIAKSIATHDMDLRAVLAPVLDFYGRPGRRAAQTRTEQKKPETP
jgi:hypothetical protein